MFQRTLRLYQNSFSGLSREVWLLAMVLLINRSGAMVIPFLTIYLTSQRGFSFADAGLVMSSFGVGSMVGSYLGGWLTDRIGFYRVQLWTLVLSGVVFWLMIDLSTVVSMSIGVFFLSLVADAFRPANQAAVAHFSRPENLARSYGLLRLAVNLGFSIGPFLGGMIIAALGYRWLFVIDGATCLAAAVAYVLGFSRQRVAVRTAVDTAKAEVGISRSAYQDKWFLLFLFFVMLGATAFMQFFGSLPIFLQQDWHYTEAQIGHLIAINGLLIVAFEMPLVHLASERFRVLHIVAFGTLLVGLSYMLLGVAPASWLLSIVFIVLLTFGEMLSMPFTSTWVAGRAPKDRRGQYMGLYSVSWAVAFIIAPSLGLRGAEAWGFDVLWWVMGGIGLASAAGLWWIRGRTGPVTPPQTP